MLIKVPEVPTVIKKTWKCDCDTGDWCFVQQEFLCFVDLHGKYVEFNCMDQLDWIYLFVYLFVFINVTFCFCFPLF